jgi:hypothetical protein
MELPAHPESDDTTPHKQPAATTSRAAVLVFVIIGVLFALMMILHLTGVVGPGAN